MHMVLGSISSNNNNKEKEKERKEEREGERGENASWLSHEHIIVGKKET